MPSSPETKLCAWCKVKPIAPTPGSRFCGTSCSAKWRMSQPEIRARVFTPELRAKQSKAQRARNKAHPELAVESSRRMIERNPMRDPKTRKKVSEAHRQAGHRPPFLGGNGRPIAKPQAKLAAALGWICEFVVRTNRTRPTHYKVDIANPSTKVAVEVDGPSHNSLKVQAADARKTAFLEAIGWLVLRVSNEDALHRTATMAASIISKSAARTRT